MNSKKILADGVLLLHFLVVVFAVTGAVFVYPHPVPTLFHILIVVWSSVVNLADWTCPLTPLEQNLRRSAGGSSYSGGCLQHYLDKLVKPLGMPRKVELIAGYSIVGWNLLLYALLYLFVSQSG